MPVVEAPVKRTVGVDHNHWQRITNIIDVDFPTYAQCAFRFKGQPKEIILTLEDGYTDGYSVGNVGVAYSFNGNTVHGEMIVGGQRTHLYLSRRPAVGIWFRALAGGGGTVTIEAWSSV